MSEQRNIEIMRSGFAAWNAGDMEALRELYDPDTVLRMPKGWPEPGPYVGRDAVMQAWADLRETWRSDALEALGESIAHGDHVATRMIWHGAGAGPEASMEFTAVYTLRDDLVVHQEFFWDHADALAAMGLR